MGNNIKDIQQIKSLIAKGKEMGFLTFEEVNKAVPLEMNTPEQFEEIIGIFDQLEIAIVDLEKDGKKSPSPRRRRTESSPKNALSWWTAKTPPIFPPAALTPSACTCAKWGRCRCSIVTVK